VCRCGCSDNKRTARARQQGTTKLITNLHFASVHDQTGIKSINHFNLKSASHLSFWIALAYINLPIEKPALA
jgi:hypothetical protein